MRGTSTEMDIAILKWGCRCVCDRGATGGHRRSEQPRRTEEGSGPHDELEDTRNGEERAARAQPQHNRGTEQREAAPQGVLQQLYVHLPRDDGILAKVHDDVIGLLLLKELQEICTSPLSVKQAKKKG